LICSFLPCLSWLLRSRVRKSRRDLWITLYIVLAMFRFHQTILRPVFIIRRYIQCVLALWDPVLFTLIKA